MSLKFLILYAVAALVLLFVIISTYREKEPIGKKVIPVLSFGFFCVVLYSVNFITDDYNIMSAATGVMLAMQDFMLVALVGYVFSFARIESRAGKVIESLATLFALADSIIFVANIFNESVLTYSLNMCDGIYVLGYVGSTWFVIHTVFNCLLLAVIIGVLIVKCMRIPKVYWGRYIYMAYAFVFIIITKYIFVAGVIDLRFDISILLYAFMGSLIYWNTFWYSKKNMLNSTHEMIINHMDVPVILFDYEGVLADFNAPMKKIFGGLELDDRSKTIEWFVKENGFPQEAENKECRFEYNRMNRSYDCHVVELTDDKKRKLGRIIVMTDITDLKAAYNDLEKSLTQSLAESDCETEEHVERTKQLSAELGVELGFSDEQRNELSMLAVLHDIGKIAIPNAILTKPDRLDNDEWEVMKTHTEKGYRIAKAATQLAPIAEGILSHHERWDGTGYPNGLKGEEIPMMSRVISVIDAYDVMTHDRPYHKAIAKEEALKELEKCAGSQFDPYVVEKFVNMERNI